jgi:signal transduction histidine kinase
MQRLLQAESLRKGGKKVVAEAVNLRTLLRGEAKQVEKQAQERGIKLIVEVPATLTVQSDPELITLVVQNFIGNAVKYGVEGAITIAARIESNGPPRCVISVSDEGPGIAVAHLERIFDAFQRGEGHGQPGVGLGLAIASQAAKLLGAQLHVESTVGRGSRFTLALPLPAPSSATATASAPIA